MNINIYDNFPTLEKLINCEIKTLKYIQDKKTIRENYYLLNSEAKNWLAGESNIKNKVKTQSRGQEKYIDFESSLPICINGWDLSVYFGFRIYLKDYSEYSYYLALVCKEKENSEKMKIIRKYHFDYTKPKASDRQPHPIFHLQYPGKLSVALQRLNAEDSHLICSLSEPRLYYTPMSLALLLNIILFEFPNEITYKIVEDSEWRNLVKENEELILRPYYKNCYNFFSLRETRQKKQSTESGQFQLFTNDFYYGNID